VDASRLLFLGTALYALDIDVFDPTALASVDNAFARLARYTRSTWDSRAILSSRLIGSKRKGAATAAFQVRARVEAFETGTRASLVQNATLGQTP